MLFRSKADPDTPAGVYVGTLCVTFDANTCDPALVSLGTSDRDHWSIEGGKVVYTAQISVTVDLTAPAAPEFTVTDGQKEGAVKVAGSAPDAVMVVLYYENDLEAQDDEGNSYTYTARTIAAIISPDENGSFSVILSKPASDARITAAAVNAAGGMSLSDSYEVAGYTAPGETVETLADPFTSVKAEQIEGRSDVTVTVYGAHMTGLVLSGEIFYRVVDTEPTSVYAVNAPFDTTGWISAGDDPSFVVKDVRDGQYIEVVQLLSETIYAEDGTTVTGVKHTVLRYGSTAVELEEVPAFTVSGTLILDDDRADLSDAVVTLMDPADSTRTYTAKVQVIGGTATYAFEDVTAGAYILSLESSADKVRADSMLIDVDQDVTVDIPAERITHHILGDVDGDGDVTTIDTALIQRYLAHLKLPDSFDEAAADADGDGEVTSSDNAFIKRYLAHMTTPYPISEPF